MFLVCIVGHKYIFVRNRAFWGHIPIFEGKVNLLKVVRVIRGGEKLKGGFQHLE